MPSLFIKLDLREISKVALSALLAFLLSFSPVLPSFKLEHFRLLGALTSDASYITWTGAGEDNRWSNPANWNENVVPGANDIATFNGTSAKDAVVENDISIAGLDLGYDYTGTIKFTSTQRVTVGTSGITQKGGTFHGGSTPMLIYGSVKIIAGRFLAPASTLEIKQHLNILTQDFNHGNGAIIFSGPDQIIFGSATLYNFSKTSTLAATLTLQSASYLVFAGNLKLNGSVAGPMRLRSSKHGEPATINPRKTVTASYLNVKDIINAGLNPIVCDQGCVNAGNSANWDIPGLSDLSADDQGDIAGIINRTLGLLASDGPIPAASPAISVSTDPSAAISATPSLPPAITPSLPLPTAEPSPAASSPGGPPELESPPALSDPALPPAPDNLNPSPSPVTVTANEDELVQFTADEEVTFKVERRVKSKQLVVHAIGGEVVPQTEQLDQQPAANQAKDPAVSADQSPTPSHGPATPSPSGDSHSPDVSGASVSPAPALAPTISPDLISSPAASPTASPTNQPAPTAPGPSPDPSQQPFAPLPLRLLNRIFAPSASAQDLPLDETPASDTDTEPVTPAAVTTVKVTNPDGAADTIEPVIAEIDGATHISLVKPESGFRPGKYTLAITVAEDGFVSATTQDFTWGVLAMNLDKSSYQAGETVNFGVGVLDDWGRTICDAGLTVAVTGPDLKIAKLKIENSDSCGGTTHTVKPDYAAVFTPDSAGTYEVLLTAATKNGIRKMRQQFDVYAPSNTPGVSARNVNTPGVPAGSDSPGVNLGEPGALRDSLSPTPDYGLLVTDYLIIPPFVTTRSSASRLYPPTAYTMSITLQANRDFTGDIVEPVPASFSISDISTNGQTKFIYDTKAAINKYGAGGPEDPDAVANDLQTAINEAENQKTAPSAVYGDIIPRDLSEVVVCDPSIANSNCTRPTPDVAGEQNTPDVSAQPDSSGVGIGNSPGVATGAAPSASPSVITVPPTPAVAGSNTTQPSPSLPSPSPVYTPGVSTGNVNIPGVPAPQSLSDVGSAVPASPGVAAGEKAPGLPKGTPGVKTPSPSPSSGPTSVAPKFIGPVKPPANPDKNRPLSGLDPNELMRMLAEIKGLTDAAAATADDAGPSAAPPDEDSNPAAAVASPAEPAVTEQYIVWENMTLKAGDSVTLIYTYDAPDISPQFYLLGPLRLYDKNTPAVSMRDSSGMGAGSLAFLGLDSSTVSDQSQSQSKNSQNQIKHHHTIATHDNLLALTPRVFRTNVNKQTNRQQKDSNSQVEEHEISIGWNGGHSYTPGVELGSRLLPFVARRMFSTDVYEQSQSQQSNSDNQIEQQKIVNGIHYDLLNSLAFLTKYRLPSHATQDNSKPMNDSWRLVMSRNIGITNEPRQTWPMSAAISAPLRIWSGVSSTFIQPIISHLIPTALAQATPVISNTTNDAAVSPDSPDYGLPITNYFRQPSNSLNNASGDVAALEVADLMLVSDFNISDFGFSWPDPPTKTTPSTAGVTDYLLSYAFSLALATEIKNIPDNDYSHQEQDSSQILQGDHKSLFAPLRSFLTANFRPIEQNRKDNNNYRGRNLSSSHDFFQGKHNGYVSKLVSTFIATYMNNIPAIALSNKSSGLLENSAPARKTTAKSVAIAEATRNWGLVNIFTPLYPSTSLRVNQKATGTAALGRLNQNELLASGVSGADVNQNRQRQNSNAKEQVENHKIVASNIHSFDYSLTKNTLQTLNPSLLTSPSSFFRGIFEKSDIHQQADNQHQRKSNNQPDISIDKINHGSLVATFNKYDTPTNTIPTSTSSSNIAKFRALESPDKIGTANAAVNQKAAISDATPANVPSNSTLSIFIQPLISHLIPTALAQETPVISNQESVISNTTNAAAVSPDSPDYGLPITDYFRQPSNSLNNASGDVAALEVADLMLVSDFNISDLGFSWPDLRIKTAVSTPGVTDYFSSLSLALVGILPTIGSVKENSQAQKHSSYSQVKQDENIVRVDSYHNSAGNITKLATHSTMEISQPAVPSQSGISPSKACSTVAPNTICPRPINTSASLSSLFGVHFQFMASSILSLYHNLIPTALAQETPVISNQESVISNTTNDAAVSPDYELPVTNYLWQEPHTKTTPSIAGVTDYLLPYAVSLASASSFFRGIFEEKSVDQKQNTHRYAKADDYSQMNDVKGGEHQRGLLSFLSHVGVKSDVSHQNSQPNRYHGREKQKVRILPVDNHTLLSTNLRNFIAPNIQTIPSITSKSNGEMILGYANPDKFGLTTAAPNQPADKFVRMSDNTATAEMSKGFIQPIISHLIPAALAQETPVISNQEAVISNTTNAAAVSPDYELPVTNYLWPDLRIKTAAAIAGVTDYLLPYAVSLALAGLPSVSGIFEEGNIDQQHNNHSQPGSNQNLSVDSSKVDHDGNLLNLTAITKNTIPETTSQNNTNASEKDNGLTNGNPITTAINQAADILTDKSDNVFNQAESSFTATIISHFIPTALAQEAAAANDQIPMTNTQSQPSPEATAGAANSNDQISNNAESLKTENWKLKIRGSELWSEPRAWQLAADASLYWIGASGASNNTAANWSTTDPAGCSGTASGAPPGTADVIVFDPDCDNNMALDTTESVAGVDMQAGYTGTITQSTGVNLTIGTSGFSIAGGAINFGDATVTDTGNWTYSSGTVTPGTSTVVFNGAGTGGAPTITGSHTLNNVTLGQTTSGSGLSNLTIASGTTLTVSGTLTFDSSGSDTFSINTGTIAAQGHITVADTYNYQGSATILINGTGSQTFTSSSSATAGWIPDININKSSGTLTLSGTILRTTTSSDWTYTAGTIDAGSSTVYFMGSGTDGAPTITGSHTLNNVTLGQTTSGSGSSTVTVASGTTLTVSGTLTFDSSGSDTFSINTGTIAAQGHITVADTYNYQGSATILINGTGSQTFTSSSSATAGWIPDININKSSGTLTLSGTILRSGSSSDWTYTAGTIDAGSSTVYFMGSGTGGAPTITGSHTLNNVTLGQTTSGSGSSTVTVASGTTLTVSGTLTFDSSGSDTFSINTGTIAAQGDITIADTLSYGGSATLLINGTGTQTYTEAGTELNLTGGVNVNKASGTLQLASAMTLDVAGQDLYLIRGTLNLAGYNLTVNDQFVIESEGIFALNGTETYSTIDTNNGSVMYNSASSVYGLKAGNTYSKDLIINNGLVGYWKFDDGTGTTMVSDSSGYSYHGTAQDTTSWTDTNAVSLNYTNPYALDFDGSSDYVTVSDSLDVTDTADLTISVWFNRRSADTDDTIIAKKNSSEASDVGWLLMLNDTSDTVIFTISDGANEYNLESTTTYTSAGWHHVAAVWDQDSAANSEIFLDGVDDNATDTGAIGNVGNASNTVNLTLGAESDAGAPFNGFLDDLRVYDQVLSEQEINALAAGSVSPTGTGKQVLTAALDVNGDLILNDGELDVSSGNYAITVAGSFENNGALFTARSGTVTLDGTSGSHELQTGGQAFYNLTVNGSGGTWTLNDDLDVDNTYTHSNGTLDANSTDNWTVRAGDFDQTGGTFTPRSGAVVVDSASNQTIQAASSLYNFQAEDPTERGLVGYWKFDEGQGTTTADSSGSGNNGTLTNSPKWTTTATSTISFDNPYSLDFDGTNDYVDVGAMTSTNTFTISLWGKRNTITDSLSSIVGFQASYAGLAVYETGQISLVSTAGSILKAWVSTWTDKTSWHNLVYKQSGAGAGQTVELFFDGVSKGTGSVTTSALNSFRIGEFVTAYGQEFPGLLDDVRIYNRALSEWEVGNLADGKYAEGASSDSVYTLAAALDLNGSMSLQSGELDVSASNYAITTAGSWYGNGGGFNPRSGTVTLDGTSGTNTLRTGAQPFNNLTVSGSGGTWNLADKLDVNGTYTQSNGTVDVTNFSLHAVDFDKTAGTLTTRDQTVVIDGTSNQTIQSNTALTNLQIEDPTETNLVGYWKFDEGQGTVARDSSGNNNHGTLTGGPAWVTTMTSTITFDNPYSLEFDGTDDYVDLASPALLDNLTTKTISFWVKRLNISSTDQQLVCKGPTGGEWCSHIRGTGKSNGPNTVRYSHYWSGSPGSIAIWSSSTLFNDSSRWYHVAVSYDSSSTANDPAIYVDGVANTVTEVQTPAGTEGDDNTGTLYIASNAWGGYATSMMDDVRIYNSILGVPAVQSLADGYYADGDSAGVATFTLGANLDVNGSLTLQSGILDVSGTNYSINLAKDWNNYGGASSFTDQAGTVTLDGAGGSNQTIRGATTFYNLTKTEAADDAADETITFETGKTQTIASTLTLDGRDSTDMINLVSSVPTTRFTLNVTGASQSVDNVDVRDSNASTNDINCTSCTNSGNNDDGESTPHWVFVAATRNRLLIISRLTPFLSPPPPDSQPPLLPIRHSSQTPFLERGLRVSVV